MIDCTALILGLGTASGSGHGALLQARLGGVCFGDALTMDVRVDPLYRPPLLSRMTRVEQSLLFNEVDVLGIHVASLGARLAWSRNVGGSAGLVVAALDVQRFEVTLISDGLQQVGADGYWVPSVVFGAGVELATNSLVEVRATAGLSVGYGMRAHSGSPDFPAERYFGGCGLSASLVGQLKLRKD
jgi:hypothetical protein